MILKEIYDYRQIVSQLVMQQLLTRYRRTIFGYLWTVLNPLLMMGITALVFSHVFRFGLRDYTIFLLAGTVPWTLFSSTLIQAGASIVGNEGLLKKIYIPKIIFPVSTSTGILLDSLFSLCALFVIALFVGAKISIALVFLPIAFALLYVFSLGLSLTLAVVMVYFRDMQHLIGVMLQAWFFVTPIMYQLDAISPRLREIIVLNPMLYFIDLFRAPIYQSVFPSLHTIGIATVLAAVSLVVGLKIFRLYENKLIFRL
ncbi:ABC transporter permease [Cupriavidus numazuensis]|uniref:Transport permease protein n=1 Tax=Cupriavidus numazuensis TaxID=221992 RepID=A0ABM8TRD5_9BURK|nr:ABC transporter permease [Cupriavidus numazuensis]CAG2158769.1 Polysialic acid transport protein KpsM [Cupriavidus numazuensis]